MKILKNTLKNILVIIYVFITLCSCTTNNNVKNNSNTNVNTNYFSYWNEDSKVVSDIKELVENAVNINSKGYVPKEDRIAVFDMDGTIFCETDPTYNEYNLLFERILASYDKNNEEDVKLVEDINEVLKTGVVSDELELKLSELAYKYYEGKTIEEYTDIVKEFLEKDTRSYKNLKIKNALYKPMLQVIDYLKANDFTVYVISGTERNFVRIVVCEGANIDRDNVIGMDFELKTTNQGDELNSVHQFDRKENIVIHGPSNDVNVKTSKVISIATEIGKIPVLAFGNSTGDFSMMEYTLKNDKYNSMGFMVLCDDNVRENGNLEKAKKIKEVADKNGYRTISMKNDFKTIYGDGVEKK